MDDIYKMSRNAVINSLNPDDDLIDVLAISYMALALNLGQVVLDKLPKLLKKANITREDNGQYIMNIDVVGSKGNLSERFRFNYPKNIKDKTNMELLTFTVYELAQLLRYKGIKEKTSYIEVNSGVSSRNVKLNGTITGIRGKELEESIVASTTKNSILGLSKYLSGEELTEFPAEFKHDLLNASTYYYDIRTHLVETLMEDESFAKMVEMSYDDMDARHFAKAYNTVMDNDASFSRLIKLYDELSNALHVGNEEQIKACATAICTEMDSFKKKAKQLRK